MTEQKQKPSENKAQLKSVKTRSYSETFSQGITIAAVVVGVFGYACKKDAKKDNRTLDPNAEESSLELPEGEWQGEDAVYDVTADSLGFRILDEINIEPESCVPLEFNVLGGKSEKYLATVAEETEIAITSTIDQSQFFTDEVCQTPLESLKLAKDSDGGYFYLKVKNEASFKLSVATKSGPTLAPAELSVKSIKGEKIKIETLPQRALVAESCESLLLTLTSKEDKEVFSAKGFKVKVVVAEGAGKLYLASDCSGEPLDTLDIPEGNTATALYIKPTVSGPLKIASEPQDSSGGYQKADFTFNVDPKAP